MHLKVALFLSGGVFFTLVVMLFISGRFSETSSATIEVQPYASHRFFNLVTDPPDELRNVLFREKAHHLWVIVGRGSNKIERQMNRDLAFEYLVSWAIAESISYQRRLDPDYHIHQGFAGDGSAIVIHDHPK